MRTFIKVIVPWAKTKHGNSTIYTAILNIFTRFPCPEIFNLTLPTAFLLVTTMPTSTTIAATEFTIFYVPDVTVEIGFRFLLFL